MNLKEFIKNEDGFLSILGGLAGKLLGGSIIGKAVGGALGVSGPQLGAQLGSAAGTHLSERQKLKSAQSYDRGRFVRLAADARAAGLNPLEALRAGGASQEGGAPRIATTASMQNQFDQIDSILTGQRAQERKRDELQDELLRVQIDQGRASAQAIRTRPVRLGSPATAERAIGDPGKAGEQEPGRETITNNNSFDSDRFVNPFNKDAETHEARSGDVIQNIAGIANLFGDQAYNSTLGQLAVMSGKTKTELHAEFAGEGGKQKYEEMRRQLLQSRVLGSDTIQDENQQRRMPITGVPGRINRTTGDIRRMPKPWDH